MAKKTKKDKLPESSKSGGESEFQRFERLLKKVVTRPKPQKVESKPKS